MWGPGMWGPRHVAGSQHMRIEAPIAPSVASRLWASTRLGGCRLLNVHERAAGGATCSLRQVSVDCQPRAWVGRLSHEGSRPRHEGRWAGPGPLGRSGRSAGRAAGQDPGPRPGPGKPCIGGLVRPIRATTSTVPAHPTRNPRSARSERPAGWADESRASAIQVHGCIVCRDGGPTWPSPIRPPSAGPAAHGPAPAQPPTAQRRPSARRLPALAQLSSGRHDDASRQPLRSGRRDALL